MKKVQTLIALLTCMSWLAVTGFAIYSIRDHLTFFAYMLSGTVSLSALSLAAAVNVLVWRKALHVDYHDKSQYGTIASFGKRVIGEFNPYTPTEQVSVVLPDPTQPPKNSIILPATVPTADELLVNGVITSDSIVLGYDGNYEPVTEFVGKQKSEVILGETQSGKTGTLFFGSVQLMICGFETIVCDPNSTKPRSLASLMSPLNAYFQLNTTFAESAEAITSVYDELQRRKRGETVNRPTALVIDEWTEYASGPFSDSLVKMLQTIAQQGAGYQIVLRLAAQLGQAEFIGGAAFRGSVPDCCVHRIAPLESKKVLPLPKDYNVTSSLPTGTVLRKSGGIVTKLMIPHADVHFAQLAKRSLIKNQSA